MWLWPRSSVYDPAEQEMQKEDPAQRAYKEMNQITMHGHWWQLKLNTQYLWNSNVGFESICFPSPFSCIPFNAWYRKQTQQLEMLSISIHNLQITDIPDDWAIFPSVRYPVFCLSIKYSFGKETPNWKVCTQALADLQNLRTILQHKLCSSLILQKLKYCKIRLLSYFNWQTDQQIHRPTVLQTDRLLDL